MRRFEERTFETHDGVRLVYRWRPGGGPAGSV